MMSIIIDHLKTTVAVQRVGARRSTVCQGGCSKCCMNVGPGLVALTALPASMLQLRGYNFLLLMCFCLYFSCQGTTLLVLLHL